MTTPVETKDEIRVDNTWGRLTHVVFTKVPARLRNIADTRRQANSLFRSK